MASPLAILILIGVAALLMVSAELARTAYAKLAGLTIRRNRLFMLAPSGQDSFGKRLGAIAIGSLGGYLAISAIALTLYQCHGTPSQTVQLVGEISPGYPADGVIVPGDRIVEIEGDALLGGSAQIQDAILRRPGAPLTLTIERDGVRRTERIVPKLSELRSSDGRPRYLLGIIFKADLTTPGIGTASGLALAFPYRMARQIVWGWIDSFTGKEEIDPAGPVRIASEARSAYERGPAEVLKLGMLVGVYWLLALIAFDLVRMAIMVVRR